MSGATDPVASRRRRLLIRAAAFLSIVCFDIRNSARSADRTNIRPSPHSYDDSSDHIQTIRQTGPSAEHDEVKISFQLHDPSAVPFFNLYAPKPWCPLGPLRPPASGGARTGELPPSLSIAGGVGRVLDFTTTISTSLKILHVGDSVTMQMAETLDEMMGGHELDSRKVLWDAGFGGANGGTIVAPTRGGGMNGGWRMTSLLHWAGQGMPDTKNRPGVSTRDGVSC